MPGDRDRRSSVPFDPRHFEKLADNRSAEAKFRDIYRSHHWTGSESASGAGSGSEQTRAVRAALPALLESLGARVLLDLPCGDFGWLSTTELPVDRIIGADLLPELIEANERKYHHPTRAFRVLDITRDDLPAADVLLCRDCFVHLAFDDIHRALGNVTRSALTWLLTTTFTECEVNEDIVTGDWRPLNLERPPFSLGPPIRLIDEECTEGGGVFADKSLGLWRVEGLRR